MFKAEAIKDSASNLIVVQPFDCRTAVSACRDPCQKNLKSNTSLGVTLMAAGKST